MAEHTPGPWATSNRPDGDVEITDKDGSVLASAYGDNCDPKCWPVAANAAVIAAAPELLAACKAALTGSRRRNRWGAGLAADTEIKLRTAIAEAEGEK